VQLGQLQDRLGEIEKAGGRLVAVSADRPEEAAQLAKRLALTFPVRPDPELRVAAAHGVRQAGLGVALPALFIVDATGKVRWRKVGESIPDRPTVDEVLAALRALAGAR
jgi:peroxiredoxin